jgi:DNA replication protein DnaC
MSAPTMELQQSTIREYARQLRLPALGSQFVQLADEAVKQKLGHVAYLEALLSVELEERERHAVARRITEAKFPKVKTLEDFPFEEAPIIPVAQIRQLAEGGYLSRSEPIIFVGDAGTGKTHLATGLAVAACRQRKRVRFTTAAELAQVPQFEE